MNWQQTLSIFEENSLLSMEICMYMYFSKNLNYLLTLTKENDILFEFNKLLFNTYIYEIAHGFFNNWILLHIFK